MQKTKADHGPGSSHIAPIRMCIMYPNPPPCPLHPPHFLNYKIFLCHVEYSKAHAFAAMRNPNGTKEKNEWILLDSLVGAGMVVPSTEKLFWEYQYPIALFLLSLPLSCPQLYFTTGSCAGRASVLVARDASRQGMVLNKLGESIKQKGKTHLPILFILLHSINRFCTDAVILTVLFRTQFKIPLYECHAFSVMSILLIRGSSKILTLPFLSLTPFYFLQFPGLPPYAWMVFVKFMHASCQPRDSM